VNPFTTVQRQEVGTILKITPQVNEGGALVGGLIQDSDIRGEQRVPYLGRIPLLGQLFKTRSRTNGKTNLMVFIRPKILRDGVATAIETGAKYNYIRDEQRAAGRSKGEVLPLLPFTKEPMLPPIPSPLPPAPAPAGPIGPDGNPVTPLESPPATTTPKP
jgi:general secretion pathway protein D